MQISKAAYIEGETPERGLRFMEDMSRSPFCVVRMSGSRTAAASDICRTAPGSGEAAVPMEQGGINLNSIYEIAGTTLTILLPAEIDHHSSEQIRLETDRLVMRRNIRRIQFDFSQAVFMDSSGIGMLIGRYKTMRFMGGTVTAIRVGERMRRILVMSGMDKVIDIYAGMPQSETHI